MTQNMESKKNIKDQGFVCCWLQHGTPVTKLTQILTKAYHQCGPVAKGPLLAQNKFNIFCFCKFEIGMQSITAHTTSKIRYTGPTIQIASLRLRFCLKWVLNCNLPCSELEPWLCFKLNLSLTQSSSRLAEP